MTRLILIRGNSGSGKTSLATRLQSALGQNTLLLSQDMIRRTMLNAKDSPDTPTIPLLLALLEVGQTTCDTIILEGILRSDWYAPVFEAIAEQFSGQVFAYHYDLTFEETLRRHATRDKAKEFGQDSMARWWVEKDYLTLFQETKLSADLSLDDAVTMILEELTKKTSLGSFFLIHIKSLLLV